MAFEQCLLLNQLPATLLRSVLQDVYLANLPVPERIIVGFRNKVIHYYRIAAPE